MLAGFLAVALLVEKCAGTAKLQGDGFSLLRAFD